MTCLPACTRVGVSPLHCLAAGDDGHPPRAADRRSRASRGDTLEPNGIGGGPGTEGSCAWKSYPLVFAYDLRVKDEVVHSFSKKFPKWISLFLSFLFFFLSLAIVS